MNNKNKHSFNSRYNTSLTYTPFILDSVIKAIHDFPLINSCLEEDNIKYNQNINMGVAVALPDDNLIVPVIKNADKKSLLEIALEIRDIAKLSRTNSIPIEFLFKFLYLNQQDFPACQAVYLS